VAAFLALPSGRATAGFADAARAYDAGDYVLAGTIWRELAAQCDARAQTSLAGLYDAGLGVPQNDFEALRWYLMAAWAGDRYAQQVAGDWYARGTVVPTDRVRAAFWLTLAAEQGMDWAAGRRDAVASTLSRAERDDVAHRLAEFESIGARMCRPAR
jgi:TPR repeat protein